MSRQKAQIKTPVHLRRAFPRNENSSLWHFTPRKKIALQLAVSLWIAGGLLGAPGTAGAQETVVYQNAENVYGNNTNPNEPTAWGFTFNPPNGNTVTVNTSVTVSNTVAGSKYHENSEDVTNNKVILMGTATNVYGGLSHNGTANNNTVEISYGTINNSVYGGESDKATAAKNTVTISGGTIKYSVYGGKGYTGVTGNTVEISGGTIENSVYGGSANYANPDAPAASVTGNIVKIF
ncbi:MAG: hypothetical protein IIT82_06325, partial [Selenomonas sp.]|nr:hypothetical protein [Selenomonas sp.]